MAKPKGYILYEGPSAINGDPIVAILTLNSTNVKTGNMAQLWILAKDTAPHIAKKEGKDDAVCGDCPIKKECYVLTFQGPLSVWNAYKRGSYETLGTNYLDLSALIIRFGAYGDPAALPRWLIKSIADSCKDFTGYTHQWNKPKFNFLKNYFMASVESYDLKDKAKKLGFRTFRIIPKIEFRNSTRMEKYYKEVTCPAENKGKQCIDCMLCNGSKQAADITIEAHGARSGGLTYA
tara:strand:+ start:1022 stop:1726 length:705 start_codon:yes stop_codon:yes gene_type:complete